MDNSHNNSGGTHITVKGYLIGFVLAVILTLVSFAMVMMRDSISKPVVIIILFAAAIIQMLVHLRYFLHIDKSSDKGWNLIALAFTALLLFIFVGGTMWVMFTLNSRMM